MKTKVEFIIFSTKNLIFFYKHHIFLCKEKTYHICMKINVSILYPNHTDGTNKCIISLAHSFENKLIFSALFSKLSCFENKIIFFLSDTSTF